MEVEILENAKIAKKLVAVMAECAYITKNGVNDYHKYKYATAEDVLQKVNESLTKNKIACFVVPELLEFKDVLNLKGNTEHLATVKVTITLIDSDNGESVQFVGMGSGQDAGDKAVMKAQTAATKYAYMLSLCIATGDDPEADSKTDENNFAAPQNAAAKPKSAACKPKSKPVTKPALDRNVITCVGCGEVIASDRVVEYSLAKFGHPLCMNCQKAATKVA